MYRQLLVVCLFLAIAADLLEAKSSLHKRSQNHHRTGRQDEPPIPAGFMQMVQCGQSVRSQVVGQQRCPPPAFLDRLNRLSPPEQFNTVLATDLSEVCAAVNQVANCVLTLYMNDTNCQQAERLNPGFPAIRRFFQRTLNFVCVERLSVFNSSKACLLGTSSMATPPVALRAAALCPQELLGFAQRFEAGPAASLMGPESIGCIPTGLQTCARNATTAQCDEATGTAIYDLIGIARDNFCVVPTAKRTWAEDFILFGKMMQIF